MIRGMFNSVEERNNIRNSLLNFYRQQYGDEEVFVFYPKAEFLVISNKGTVKNLKTQRVLTGCKNSDGYSCIKVCNSNKSSFTKSVHRLVAETFLPYLNNFEETFYEVNHIDGNINNNDITNLEWVTRRENIDHAKKNGAYKKPVGELSRFAKLSNRDVSDIREFYSLGFTIKEISKAYKVTFTHVWQIVNNKSRIKNENC